MNAFTLIGNPRWYSAGLDLPASCKLRLPALFRQPAQANQKENIQKIDFTVNHKFRVTVHRFRCSGFTVEEP
ncbi:MAG: hypothetical protein BA872_02260 [Desulfobacterales bacterium C00003060]|nr:MAG: hypothetical protein BA861_09590 [Desulfobacterales bacterium S3730MH5]OEU78288.1 MAG: hypothetical protein BA872_02260 [Desulfobacterales bacterium C00003060]OEU82756.1 MAG: hypothetical protein BA865_06035 [Desulfobacterales bacterium S5133MH4]